MIRPRFRPWLVICSGYRWVIHHTDTLTLPSCEAHLPAICTQSASVSDRLIRGNELKDQILYRVLEIWCIPGMFGVVSWQVLNREVTEKPFSCLWTDSSFEMLEDRHKDTFAGPNRHDKLKAWLDHTRSSSIRCWMWRVMFLSMS